MLGDSDHAGDAPKERIQGREEAALLLRVIVVVVGMRIVLVDVLLPRSTMHRHRRAECRPGRRQPDPKKTMAVVVERGHDEGKGHALRMSPGPVQNRRHLDALTPLLSSPVQRVAQRGC